MLGYKARVKQKFSAVSEFNKALSYFFEDYFVSSIPEAFNHFRHISYSGGLRKILGELKTKHSKEILHRNFYIEKSAEIRRVLADFESDVYTIDKIGASYANSKELVNFREIFNEMNQVTLGGIVKTIQEVVDTNYVNIVTLSNPKDKPAIEKATEEALREFIK